LIESIQALLRLQDIDLCIEAAQAEVDQIPSQRESALADRSQADAQASASTEELQGHEQLHRQREAELNDVEVLLEKLDAQLYEITSQQALAALQHEVATARQHKSEHEDAILELLDQVDVARDALVRAEANQREVATSTDAAEQARAEREPVLATQLGLLAEARVERQAGLESGVIEAYDAARWKRLPAVIFIDARSCPSCRIMVAPQRLVDLRNVTKLVTCGSCGCILYGEKVRQAEQAG
jgi:predicted  nucleic acid-binding Zn-ribbon protein